MNTPSPCDKCNNLYWDLYEEEDPFGYAECTLKLKMGNEDCPKFERDDEPVSIES